MADLWSLHLNRLAFGSWKICALGLFYIDVRTLRGLENVTNN
jgi:hypothetical protein